MTKDEMLAYIAQLEWKIGNQRRAIRTLEGLVERSNAQKRYEAAQERTRKAREELRKQNKRIYVLEEALKSVADGVDVVGASAQGHEVVEGVLCRGVRGRERKERRRCASKSMASAT